MTLDPNANHSALLHSELLDDGFERLVNEKTWNIHMQLQTKKGVEKFLHDYEPDLTSLIQAHANSNTLAASIAYDKLVIEHATFEAEREWL